MMQNAHSRNKGICENKGIKTENGPLSVFGNNKTHDYLHSVVWWPKVKQETALNPSQEHKDQHAFVLQDY